MEHLWVFMSLWVTANSRLKLPGSKLTLSMQNSNICIIGLKNINLGKVKHK